MGVHDEYQVVATFDFTVSCFQVDSLHSVPLAPTISCCSFFHLSAEMQYTCIAELRGTDYVNDRVDDEIGSGKPNVVGDIAMADREQEGYK